ncbi:Pleckstrin y domain-containing G member 1 [Halocaridina rubra]|uniref:Pleckstrin y domain-containing G member 1 n=1 Tax=Halocaridina rubra TaxID=373956 RepID=A0AAN9AAP8_HALRR
MRSCGLGYRAIVVNTGLLECQMTAKGYLEYWRRHPESGIGRNQADDLFSNIEQIYTFNRGFLSELEACGVDPVAVARCFVRNNSGFSIYTQYCTNYPRTVSVLTELMRGEPSVRAFRERQLALSHTLPLGSYLLKPVQRILKYHLLLGNIVKHFEKDCSGYSEIWNALSAMTGMAHHINDMKRRHEHAVRVQEIQSLLYGWQFEDLTTFGELAAEGTFRMCGAKGLRHIFLFEKMILIAKKKEENTLMYKAHILCSNLMLIESVPGEPLCFHIIPFDNPRLQYTLEARNLEQKREWTLQLKRVILENYSANIPAHARQLVMELGQSKPEDLLMCEARSSGRRAHHAPEYLEKRKVDRERRRSSEGGLNTRLRIRRSSRTRKEKEELKGSRSRSVSRTRETEDEDADRKISINSAPSSSEKPKLKISNMWGRRRSEPGIGSRESLSVAHSAPEDIDPPSPLPPDTPSQVSMNTQLEATTPEVLVDGFSASEYEREEETGKEDNDGENGENLEEIVSQILQRELQLQKLLLNKQRRNLMRKKIPFKYETSDTENEDGPSRNEDYVGSDAGSALRHDDAGDYVDFYFNERQSAANNESANASSSECQSLYSSAVSVHHPSDFKPLASDKHNKPVRRSSSDLSFKKAPANKKTTNYDNLINIWSTIRGKSPEKKNNSANAQTQNATVSTVEKPRLRRAQSFSLDKCQPSNSENIYVPPPELISQPNSAPVQSSKKEDIWVKDEQRESPRENRERPVTIAIYNSNEVSLGALEQYLNQPRTSSHTHERFPYDTEDNFTDYSVTPHMSMDNILSIHPEHKIYKPSNNRNTLKSVFSKITSPKSNKAVSEPSGSVFNYSVDSELDRSIDKKASKMVYNMARQCSKTLKERIKQIRAEDVERSPTIKSKTENPYSFPIYKQGSSSIGARLAGTNEPSDYAVPRIRPMDQKPKSDIRPDSVLSSSSILTSSSSSSSSSCRDTKFLEGVEVSSMANVEEENEENQESPSFESDASADSYYERSFEAIENLETEIFRDSAIYSDPEDPESPPNSLHHERSPTSPKIRSSLSRKSSSRSSKNSPISSKLKSSAKSVSLTAEVLQSSSKTNSVSKSPDTNPLSPQQKKVPPPVPAKPDNIKSKGRPCGNLIMQQLKNLEECSKFNRDDQTSPSFDGIKTLDDRRKNLMNYHLKVDGDEVSCVSPTKELSDRESSPFRHSRLTKSPSLVTPTPIIKSPITLSPLSSLSGSSLPGTRSSSVPPRLSSRPSLTPESPKPSSLGLSSPLHGDRDTPRSLGAASPIEDIEKDEPKVSRGWVRHVIGKLQAENDS